MILFTKPMLTMAIQNCMETMDQIDHILTKSNICAPGAFSRATRDENADEVNGILEKAISKYTGDTNIVFGLRKYCEKYGIPVTKDMPSERYFFKLISDNAARIEGKINEIEGRNA